MPDYPHDAASVAELIFDLKQLQLALRLPLRLLFDGETVSAAYGAHAPSDDEASARRPLVSLPIVPGHALIPQHLKSAGAERFLYFSLTDDWSLLIGPYRYASEDETFEQMIRRGLYTIDDLAGLEQAFAVLPQLDQAAAVAVGRLAAEHYAQRRQNGEFPFDAEDPREKSTARQTLPGLSTPLPDNYYRVQLEDRSSQYAHPPIRIEEQLSACIENGDETGAITVLRRLNRLERAKLADNPLRSLKNSLIGSMTIFTRAAIAGGVPDQTSFTLSDAYIRQIESTPSGDALERIEAEAVRDFAGLVKEEKERRYSIIVRRVMRHVDLHLTDSLRLDDLARLVHLHPNYLSSLFHRETGQRLSDFIRDKRLEEAFQMIRHSNNSLKQIAAFYRFNSQSYFSRCFKARFGLTPSDLARGKGQTAETKRPDG